MSVTRGRRALQITGRSLTLTSVFAAVYLVVVNSVYAASLKVDAALVALLFGAGACALVILVWAFGDGRRPDAVPRPVQLWAGVALASSVVMGLLVLALWIFIAAAMGGSMATADLLWMVPATLGVAVVAAGAGTAVAAAAVRVGDSSAGGGR